MRSVFIDYSLYSRRSSKWWKKVFLRLFELCVINALCLYKIQNPNFSNSRRPHTKFREALIYEMTQPLFDKRAKEEATCNADLPETSRTRCSVVSVTRLKGKHYSIKHWQRKKCTACAYKVNPKTGKRKDTKTQNFSVKS